MLGGGDGWCWVVVGVLGWWGVFVDGGRCLRVVGVVGVCGWWWWVFVHGGGWWVVHFVE